MKIPNFSKLIGRVEQQRKGITAKLLRLKREDPFATEDRSIIVEPGTDASALFGHEKTMVLEQQLKNDLKEIEKRWTKSKKAHTGYVSAAARSLILRD